MKLDAYLKKEELSQEEFGKRFAPAVSQGLVSQWVVWLNDEEKEKGTRITAERAIEIEKHTAGAVKRHELRPDIFPAPSTQKARAA